MKTEDGSTPRNQPSTMSRQSTQVDREGPWPAPSSTLTLTHTHSHALPKLLRVRSVAAARGQGAAPPSGQVGTVSEERGVPRGQAGVGSHVLPLARYSHSHTPRPNSLSRTSDNVLASHTNTHASTPHHSPGPHSGCTPSQQAAESTLCTWR